MEINKLEIKNLTVKFGEKTVFENINLECKSGKIYGIIGYNGCGKSVLFKCICGFVNAFSGDVFFDGKKLNNDIRHNIGMLIENPAFVEDKSALKNLEYLYMINNKPDKKYLSKVLEMVGLDPNSKKIVSKFSLGMKQRLGIAQAIMEKPRLLILDEPMNGLDKDGVRDIRELLLKLKADGVIILLASHNREDINILCDKVYEFDNGHISVLDGVLPKQQNAV